LPAKISPVAVADQPTVAASLSRRSAASRHPQGLPVEYPITASSRGARSAMSALRPAIR